MVQPEQLYSRIKSLKRIAGNVKTEMQQYDKLGLLRDAGELKEVLESLRNVIERSVSHRKALL